MHVTIHVDIACKKILVIPNERPENFWLPSFIESVNTHLDLEQLERVELWGGEPFLYWNDMMAIMKLLDAPNRHFYNFN